MLKIPRPGRASAALTFTFLCPLVWLASSAWASVPAQAAAGESTVASTGPAPGFEVPPSLRKNVDFWVSIYGRYYTYQGLIHDAKYVDKVYEVLDFKSNPRSRHSRQRQARLHWREVLLSVHHKQSDPGSMNAEERKVYEMWSDVNDPNKFESAAHRKRLRFQLGQKEQFVEGYKASGRYLPQMEAVFRKEGLPVELTRLPFVESSFNLNARSKVGASGIWQFMRSTGHLFLTINEAVDERNDPIRATEAAAKLLKGNYESLGSWPLAVTAYNHGRKGMMRAVRQVGSEDFADVFDQYRGRTFGFASSNFFTCLLAALEVERNASKYLGQVERDAPLKAFEAPIEDFISVRELARFLKLEPRKIAALNPALSDSVLDGKQLIPAGYRLRLPLPRNGDSDPERASRIFLAGYEKIPHLFKQTEQGGRGYGTRSKKRRRRK